MKKISLSIIALAALAASNIAAAQQSNAYVGIQVGTARADLDCSGATSCDKSDTAAKVYGGYKFTPQLAVELGYADLGKFSGSAGGASINWKTTSLGVGLAYHVPFNKDWSGVARLGVASNEAKVSATLGSLSGSDSKRKTKPYLGLGIGYALTPQATLTGAWDWTESEFADEKVKLNVFSVGVNFAF